MDIFFIMFISCLGAISLYGIVRAIVIGEMAELVVAFLAFSVAAALYLSFVHVY